MTQISVDVYPSQLKAFKEKAKYLSVAIAESLNLKPLSGFDRNTYLAKCLHHKNHSELIKRSKRISQQDDWSPLLLLKSDNIVNSIINTYCTLIPELDEPTMRKILFHTKETSEAFEYQAFAHEKSVSLQAIWVEEQEKNSGEVLVDQRLKLEAATGSRIRFDQLLSTGIRGCKIEGCDLTQEERDIAYSIIITNHFRPFPLLYKEEQMVFAQNLLGKLMNARVTLKIDGIGSSELNLLARATADEKSIEVTLNPEVIAILSNALEVAVGIPNPSK